MPKTFILLLLLILTLTSYGQAYETSTTFKKNATPALAIEVPYATEIAEGTLITRLDQAGADIEKKGALFWKSNKIDGFLTFKNTALPDLAYTKLDLYFKVVKRRADNSLIYMLMSDGDEHFISPTANPAAFETGKAFMNKMLAQTTTYKWEVDVKSQEEAYNKAQKRMKNLQQEHEDLLKRRKRLEDDIAKNVKEQEAQTQEVTTQQQKLTDLRGRKN
jgi:hypothetical protein